MITQAATETLLQYLPKMLRYAIYNTDLMEKILPLMESPHYPVFTKTMATVLIESHENKEYIKIIAKAIRKLIKDSSNSSPEYQEYIQQFLRLVYDCGYII